ncbi:hypothetical protein [Actinorugispora endophytica]|uniref:Uncharacterized protein n=1 Tax=Actinorugispora endophytica TaxID=1605990 RepID=A0A4R6V8H9_9ACTN|nr:hypothetical protein [Actinorugispora endophytica]TDQ55449.1 hypothetical protein EV190_101776 [Actinorugispora endophytica]
MPVSVVRGSVVPLALLLATAGCSGEVPGNLGQPPIEEVDDLRVLCEDIGEGYSGAAGYSGGGPHPPAMFFEAAAADTDTSPGPRLLEAREDAAPDATPIQGWFPAGLDEVELLVCATGHGKGEELHDCEYDSGSGRGGEYLIPMHSQDFSVTVYELATGRTVHESDFTVTNGHFIGSGLTTDCPSWLQYEEVPSELYAQPSAEEIHAEIGHVVEGDAL